jgi:flagellar hook protein FlgE
MSSGFSIGLAGLRANSSAIEIASKNIASSSVVGFKSSEYLFQEALSSSIGPSQGGRFTSGGTAGLTKRSYAAGSTRYSASPLDMSINGDGMFSIGLFKDYQPGRTYYTRNGQFLTDKEGYIVNANGLYLMGYQPNKDYTSVSNVIGPMKEPVSPMPAKTTTSSTMQINLDARTPVIEIPTEGDGEEAVLPLDIEDPTTFSHTSFLTIYDVVGKQHTISLYFQKIAGENPLQTTYNVFASVDGQIFASPAESGAVSVSMPVAIPEGEDPPEGFTPDGKPIPVGPVTTLIFDEGNLVQVGDSETSKKLTFTLVPPEGVAFDPGLTLEDELNFTLDFSGTTCFASTFEVKDISQDGFAAGSLTALTVDEKGLLRGQFSNGKNLIAGQLMLATFRGLGGLSEVSPNTFQSTDASGDPILGTASTGSFGTVRSQSLEEANTDMAQELVKLMVQQRNYQANAQSIRAQDELITTTIQMTR